jgi:hypothetical protein
MRHEIVACASYMIEGQGRDGDHRPDPRACKVASTQREGYKSQRPEVHRGVGVTLLHLTKKEERKNG